MKWAEFKQLTVRELIQFGDALALASSVEAGLPQPDVQWRGRPIQDVAEDLFFDFVDNGILKFKEGSLAETLTDTGLGVVRGSVEVVDKVLGLVRLAAPVLSAKPLANVPI